MGLKELWAKLTNNRKPSEIGTFEEDLPDESDTKMVKLGQAQSSARMGQFSQDQARESTLGSVPVEIKEKILDEAKQEILDQGSLSFGRLEYLLENYGLETKGSWIIGWRGFIAWPFMSSEMHEISRALFELEGIYYMGTPVSTYEKEGRRPDIPIARSDDWWNGKQWLPVVYTTEEQAAEWFKSIDGDINNFDLTPELEDSHYLKINDPNQSIGLKERESHQLDPSVIQKIILTSLVHIKSKGDMSFLDLERILDHHRVPVKGQGCLLWKGFIVWPEVSSEMEQVYRELYNTPQIGFIGTDQLTYYLDGRVPNIPMLGSGYYFAGKQWLPMLFVIKEKADTWLREIGGDVAAFRPSSMDGTLRGWRELGIELNVLKNNDED